MRNFFSLYSLTVYLFLIVIRDVYSVIHFQFINHIVEEEESYVAYKWENCALCFWVEKSFF